MILAALTIIDAGVDVGAVVTVVADEATKTTATVQGITNRIDSINKRLDSCYGLLSRRLFIVFMKFYEVFTTAFLIKL